MSRGGNLIQDDVLQVYRTPPKIAALSHAVPHNVFSPGEKVRFTVDGATLSDQVGYQSPFPIEKWDLYDSRHGELLTPQPGAGATVPRLGEWAPAEAQNLPEGHYHVRLRTLSSTATGGYSIWAGEDGDEQGATAFCVLRSHPKLPRPTLTDPYLSPLHGDDMRLRAMIGQGVRMEIRLHDAARPVEQWQGMNAEIRAYLDKWYYPYQSGHAHPIPVTFPDFRTGDGPTVTQILQSATYDHPEMIAIPTNEPDSNGTPEMGALGGGAVVEMFVEFRRAVKAVRPSMRVGTPPAVRIDASTISGHRAFYQRLTSQYPSDLPDVVNFHDYPGDLSIPGYVAQFDGFFTDFLAVEFPAIAALPRHIDESAGSGDRHGGHGRRGWQCLGVMAPQVVRRRYAIEPQHTNWFYVNARANGDEWSLEGSGPTPAVQQMMVDVQEYMDVNPATVTSWDIGGQREAIIANIGDRPAGAKLLHFLPFQSNARLKLHVSGAASIGVRSGWGPDLAPLVPDAGGFVEVVWDDMASRYLHLPAGAVVTYLGPPGDLIPEDQLGVQYISGSGVQSYGQTSIRSVVSGRYRDIRSEPYNNDGEAEGQARAVWTSPDTLSAVPEQTLRVFFTDGPKIVRHVQIEGPVPVHQQCAPRAGRVSAPVGPGGASVVLGSFDIPHVELNWPSTEWNGRVLTLGDGSAAAVAPGVTPAITAATPYIDVTITRTTAGGAPSMETALMRGVDPGGSPNLMQFANGLYTQPRPMLARIKVWADNPTGSSIVVTQGFMYAG